MQGAPRAAAVLTAAALSLTLGCAGRSGLILATLPEHDVAALVDSEQAQRLLAAMLARGPAHPRGATLARHALAPDVSGSGVVLGSDLHSQSGPRSELGPSPEPARLRDLAREVSVDFAALTFARGVADDERSRVVQAAFEHYQRKVSFRRPSS